MPTSGGMRIRRRRGCRGGVLAGYPQAVHRGDREQRGHVGDGGVVAADEVLPRVGDRWRERAAEGVDELAAGVPGEVGAGLDGRGAVSMATIWC